MWFLYGDVNLNLLLWQMYCFDAQGTPDGQSAGWVLRWILNTILSSNPWRGALAFQLMCAIPVPTEL